MDPLVPLSQINLLNLIFTSFTNQTLGNIILIILLIFIAAFFSMAETAFSTCNKVRLKIKAEDGNRHAKLAMKVIDNYDKSLVTILIGHNVVNFVASAIATLVFVSFIANEGVASVVSTVIMTILVLLFGEIIPKNIAKANADKACLILAYPVRFLMIILYPVSIIFYGITLLIMKIFNKKEEEPEMTEDDLQNIVEAIEEEGVIDEEESDLIQSAIEFDSIIVKEIFTPRRNMYAINIREDRDEIIKTLIEGNVKFSRIPVYDGSIDNIIGILHLRRFLKEYMLDKEIDIKSLLIEPYFVKPNIKLDDMLDGFAQHKTHIAIVMNNNDRVVGMVTMDDVLEELVGEQKNPKGSDAKC